MKESQHTPNADEVVRTTYIDKICIGGETYNAAQIVKCMSTYPVLLGALKWVDSLLSDRPKDLAEMEPAKLKRSWGKMTQSIQAAIKVTEENLTP